MDWVFLKFQVRIYFGKVIKLLGSRKLVGRRILLQSIENKEREEYIRTSVDIWKTKEKLELSFGRIENL